MNIDCEAKYVFEQRNARQNTSRGILLNVRETSISYPVDLLQVTLNPRSLLGEDLIHVSNPIARLADAILTNKGPCRIGVLNLNLLGQPIDPTHRAQFVRFVPLKHLRQSEHHRI